MRASLLTCPMTRVRARSVILAWLPMAFVLALSGLANGAGTQSAPEVGGITSAPEVAEPITPISPPPAADPAKLALGESLFRDLRLSRNETSSCFSCHDTGANGATRTRFDTASDGSPLPVNTSTVFNAALSFRLMWGGDTATLQSQAEQSMRAIMGTDPQEVAGRLAASTATAALFRAAYGHGPDGPSLLDAIATFERSLLTPGSRFDRWLGGDRSALSPQEVAGYGFFKSFGCIACHQGVNVGGNLFERYGIFHPLVPGRPRMLRVPSLRNIAATAPYFHDGSVPTLPEAVRAMSLAQLNRELSDSQVDAIVAFLGSLTGTYRGKLVTPP